MPRKKSRKKRKRKTVGLGGIVEPGVGAYPHWFRHSLATQLAEEGFTPWELKEWFDWSRFQTAVNYVEGTPSMTERISKRKVG